MKKEVIILAMGDTRNQCDFAKGCEVWTVNNGYRQVAEMHGRIDKVFLAHTQCYYPEDKTPIFDWEEMNTLADAGVDILNIHRVKGLKARLYPLKRLFEKFETEFYSDTIAYMQAYAIDQWTIKKNGKVQLKDPDAEHIIWMYGVDMLSYGEYQLEKGGVEYWIGYARGLGIKVNISKGSSLTQTCTGKPYGQKYYTMRDLDYGKLEKLKVILASGEAIPLNPCVTTDPEDIMEATRWNPPAAIAVAERAWEKK